VEGITTDLWDGFHSGMLRVRDALATDAGAIGPDLWDVLERMPVAVAVHAFDTAGSVVFVNEPFIRLLGYTRDDIPTVDQWTEKAFPEMAYRQKACETWDAAVAKARAEAGRVEGLEYRVACKDGTVRDVMFGASVVGQFLMVTLSDVTRHREAERSLQAATEGMRLAAAAAGFGFWTRDLESEIEEWDDQMLHLYGVSREAFDGRWEPFLHPDDRERAAAEAQRAIDEGRYGDYVFRIVRSDGTIRHLRGMSQVIRDADGRPVIDIGVDIDITRQVEAEAALAAVREQERQAEEGRRRDLEKKLKTSLSAAAAAHEIKQPLSRILMETQLTIERLQGRMPDEGDLGRYLETVLAESQHVVDMVSRMKALLRNVESHQGPVELVDVVAAAILHSRRCLASHGVTLHEAGLDAQARIHGDGGQVQSAVINLIRNAVEAVGEANSPRREVAVTVAAVGNRVEIVVGDSGPGMPDDVIADLPLVTSKPDGTGLGLYLVQTCIENHGGSLTIGRSPLGGAEVRLSFPALEPRA
jgi:PAS domain S-box-containing protein